MGGSNPFGDTKFTEHNWRVLDALRGVSGEIGRPLAQAALAWVAARPGVASVLIGASKAEQVSDNVASLELAFTLEQLQRLNDASAPEPVYPYTVFSPDVKRMVFGGASVEGWRP